MIKNNLKLNNIWAVSIVHSARPGALMRNSLNERCNKFPNNLDAYNFNCILDILEIKE